MPFSQLEVKDLSMNGMEVEVERAEGKVVKVQAGEKLLYLASMPKSAPKADAGKLTSSIQPAKGGPLQLNHVEHVRDRAHAPYNFIPLNDKVVTLNEPIPAFNTYHADRHTGWVDLEIETVTPLYIRGTLTEDEVEAGKESKDKSDFFSPGGQVKIPGSSLRGMIRTLVEITSYGKFGYFDDKGLYYRGLADKSNLRQEYQQHMSSYDKAQKRTQYKMSAGFLYRDRFNYYIRPAPGFRQILKKEVEKRLGTNYERFTWYKFGKDYLVVSGDMPNKKKEWLVSPPTSNEKIPIPEIDVKNYKNDSTRAKVVPNLIALANEREGIPCFYVRWQDNAGNERVSFGHTPMFRLAYELSINDHIPDNLTKQTYRLNSEHLQWIQDDPAIKQQKGTVQTDLVEKLGELDSKEYDLKTFEEKIDAVLKTCQDLQDREQVKRSILKHAYVCDIAEAIFGNERLFAGRVFFEDTRLCAGQTNVLMAEKDKYLVPKILSSPKPTTFQHYLVQTSDNNRELQHYNTPTAAIRGNKLYWHKSGTRWEEPDLQELPEDDTQHTKINPVRPGVKFTGRLRFENLSDVELGVLLFALDLPEGCYHKLGMGKPLGLGSVKITPKLYLSKRKERYQNLFAEWEHDIPESNEIPQFKSSFEDYVLRELGQEGTLWDTNRLRELKIILNYAIGEKLEQQEETQYMEIERQIPGKPKPENEFKNRPVLPIPSTLARPILEKTTLKTH
jgi:CRISPR/Cas system CSM-associated protein Csm3 (group 7 of RAMP superfamily)